MHEEVSGSVMIESLFLADIRAWLLSNPLLENPLDLWVYCHRRSTGDRVYTRPVRRHHYLPKNAIANWPPQPRARTGIQARQKEDRPDPSPANARGNQANYSQLFLRVSNSSSFESPTQARDLKQSLYHHHPPLQIPLNPSIFVYPWLFNRYPK